MQINEDSPLTEFLVTAYEAGTIWVNQIPYSHSIILTPEQVELWDGDFHKLLKNNIELVLIGTGTAAKLIMPEQLVMFYEKNIGVEVMNTQAACRTYNLLANEGRKVIAGLLV
ncbi:MAG: MTH938/NDUFAF3 family protein [Gammaproteobacteria bacterium]